ncbi:MAG: hypothetical protein CFH10_00629 [Alphaproteobacteria bacterium MarineAlpha4_Bin2]|nr:MAG: hypothetical protein CFH10_00629 [Alphaproteobacteria bacterium MarineAlpha4_Bin2]
MKEQFPNTIDEPNVWTAANFGLEDEWLVQLSADNISEIERAMDSFLASGIPPQKIHSDIFLLPELAPILLEAHREVEYGRGFLVLRGWPSERFSYDQNIAAYCGVASYLGETKVQNYEGEAIVDVIDEDKPYDQTSRGYMSNKRLPFHSDGADIVGLMCLGEPIEGGTSLLVSATKLYNVIRQEHPEILPTLIRGFKHHRRGQHDRDEPPVTTKRIPIFSFNSGLLHCCYNRNPIEWTVHEGLMLTPEDLATLDYLDELCNRPGMAVKMTFREGDMQFVNNFVILHSRSAYRDKRGHRRHLVRLWLENKTSRRGASGLLDIYVPGSSKVSEAKAGA